MFYFVKLTSKGISMTVFILVLTIHFQKSEKLLAFVVTVFLKFFIEIEPFYWRDMLTVNHVVGIIVFLWASWEQHKATARFAALRKNKQGK